MLLSFTKVVNMEKKLVNFIKYAPMIFIPLVVFLVFYLIITGYKSTLNSNFEIYKNDLIDKQKSLVKTNIQIATQIFENQVLLTENKEKAYKSFLNLIKNINNKASDYYFIFNTKGDVIVHSFLSHLEGQNLYIVDNENYNNVVKIITQNSSQERFVKYKWLNPSTNLIEDKISFVRQLPNSDLIIGSGFYLEDINKIVENQRDIELKEHDKNINVTLSLAIFFTILSFIISYIISKMLLNAFNILNKSLKEKSIELQKLNSELEIKVENRTNKLKTAYKKMKDLASIDDLTKIYNRYYFFNIFNQQLEKLKSDIQQLVRAEIFINIHEVKKSAIDSTLVAQTMAQQLESRVSFRKAMKSAIQNAFKQGAKGVKVACSGRLGGAEIARTEWYREGRVPLHTLRADIDYGTAQACTTYGIIGVKVWIYKGEFQQIKKTNN